MSPSLAPRLVVGTATLVLLLGHAPAPSQAQNQVVAPVDNATLARIEQYVADELDRYRIPGLAVGIVQGGETVYAGEFGEATIGGTAMASDNVFLLASVSKMITATSLMALVEDGLVDLHAPASTYLPELSPHGDQITVQDFMHHRSGLRRTEGASPFVGGEGASLPANVSRLGSLLRPGSGFEYSNANYDALALIVERASGMPYDRFVAQRVFAPAGMTESWVGPDGASTPRLATGHYRWILLGYRPHVPWMPPGMSGSYLSFSTVEDLSRLMIVHLNDGSIGGTEVLSPASVAALHRPYQYGPDDFPIGYAGGLSVFPGGRFVDEPDRLTDDVTHLVHSGASASYRSFLTMSPDTGIGVVLLANANDSSDEDIVPQIAQNISYLVYGEPTREIVASQDTLQRWGKELVLGVLVLQVVLAALSIRPLRGLRRRAPIRRSGWIILIAATALDLFVSAGLLVIIPGVAEAPLRVVASLPDYRLMIAALAIGLSWGAIRTALAVLWLARVRGRRSENELQASTAS